MSYVLSTLRSIAVVAGLWLLLALIGLIAGVIPFGADDDEAEPAVGDAGVDAASPARDAGRDASKVAPRDAGRRVDATVTPVQPTETSPAAPPTGTIARFTVCDAAPHVTLRAAQVLGGPIPELIVGCGSAFTLIAATATRQEPRATEPVHIARFERAASEGAPSLLAGRAAAGDIDGDGLPDLLLPFYEATPRGAIPQGSLYLLRRRADGGFEAARALASFAASAAQTGAFDTAPGEDFVALNRGHALSRRPSELWTFAGGASPARTGVLRGGLGGEAVTSLDLDRDGHLDLALLARDEPRIDVFFGDGAGHFPRTVTIAMEGGTELAAGDADGDGGTDLWILGTPIRVVRAGPPEGFEPRTVEAPAIQHAETIDLDHDGKRDLVGVLGAQIVWLRQTGPMQLASSPLLSFEGGPFRPGPFAIADLDGDGALDLALLGRGLGESAPWEIALIRRIREQPSATRVDPRATALPDAPLTLAFELR